MLRLWVSTRFSTTSVCQGRTEEAERLSNRSIRLLNSIAAYVDVFELDGRSLVCEPRVAGNHRGEAV